MKLVALALLVSIPSAAQTQTADAAVARERGAAVPAPTALLLAGKPFPSRPEVPRLPAPPRPRRTFFVAAGASNGDGSEDRPWNDLQSALRTLVPGDRLRVRAGNYSGPAAIDGSCRDGETGSPIQVVFDGKAVLAPPESGAALTIGRANWLLVHVLVDLGDSAAAGIAFEAGARDVVLDGARVVAGRGPGIRVGAGASQVTISASRVSKTRVPRPRPESVGIQVLGGASGVVLIENHLHENPAGSLRIEAPRPGEKPVRDLLIADNTIRDDDSTAIRIAAAEGVRIVGNTVSDQAGRPDTRGIVLERVSHAVVRSNHVVRCALAFQVGLVESGQEPLRAEDVIIDHNVLENAPRSGTAVAIEAGSGIRFVNNVIDGYANGILVLGPPEATRSVTAANNLLLGLTEIAIRLPDLAAAPAFDYNVFAPAGAAMVEVGETRESVVRWVKSYLPHSSVAPRARMLGHDLARIEGVPTVDRGRRIDGLEFLGAAPDIGVAEK